jgi:hypothetical protein
MGRARKPLRWFFCGQINMNMISKINFSNLFPVKHKSPVGNSDGYYLTPAQALDKKKKKQNGKPTSTIR